MNNLIKIAKAFKDKYNVSPIPIYKKSKRPSVKWADYQKRVPTDKELVKLFSYKEDEIGGFAALWATTKQKLRMWPYPH